MIYCCTSCLIYVCTVQSPKASTPFPHHGQTTPPNHTNHTCSLANEINRRFATAHAMTDTASVSVDMVNPALDGTEPAGRSLLDAMSSNFTNGAPLSPSSNTYNRNKVVKDVSLLLGHLNAILVIHVYQTIYCRQDTTQFKITKVMVAMSTCIWPCALL